MSDKIYSMITERIQEKLEQGIVPWQKPWVSQGLPKNLNSGKEYRGINVFLLAIQEYNSPYWLTLKQANDRGGKVKVGEKSTPVVYWNWTDVEDKETGEKKKVPFLRYYRVFNVEQCEGVEYPVAAYSRPLNPISECAKLVDGYRNKPRVEHGGSSAYYRPSEDKIQMPPTDSFQTDESYYSTLFHELTHSTGHKERLNRAGITDISPFGSVNYGKEELIAEMGAAFLCGITGIENRTIDNSVAYLSGWIKAIKKDKKLIVQAAASAQKAVDHILGKKYSD